MSAKVYQVDTMSRENLETVQKIIKYFAERKTKLPTLSKMKKCLFLSNPFLGLKKAFKVIVQQTEKKEIFSSLLAICNTASTGVSYSLARSSRINTPLTHFIKALCNKACKLHWHILFMHVYSSLGCVFKVLILIWEFRNVLHQNRMLTCKWQRFCFQR